MTLTAVTLVTLRVGPMAGIIEKIYGDFKFVVIFDFIQRGLSLTVDCEWLV